MAPPSPQSTNAANKKRPKIKGSISIVHNAKSSKLIRHPGCYQCSRRRIDCDRQQPTCHKCATKGMTCSGLGIRYRFNGSLASRGKLVGKTIPTRLSYGGETDAGRSSLINVDSTTAPHKIAQSQFSERKCTARQEEQSRSQSGDPRMTPQWLLSSTKNEERATQEDEDATVMIRCLTQVDGKTQFLMQYCRGAFVTRLSYQADYFSTVADHIAPAAAVIDRGWNGFRDLLLPYAETEPFVKRAIEAVSRQHIILRFGGDFDFDIREYNILIAELIARSRGCPPNQDIASLVVLLLLHHRETVSGGNGFKYLYGSLKALPDLTIQNSMSGQLYELARFVNIQILR